VLKDGKVFVKGNDNEWSQVSYDPYDPWSEAADQILSVGSTNNTAYRQVVNDRVANMRDTSDYSRLRDVSTSDPVYKKIFSGSDEFNTSYYMDGNDRKFKIRPDKGDTVIYNGKLYEVTQAPTYKDEKNSGYDSETITLRDVINGKSITLDNNPRD
jgi:hypothetical protein